MKIRYNITELRWIKKALVYSRRIVIPGFDGMPLYDVMVFFIKGLYEGSLSIRASAVSFNFFIAIFPTIIFLFTIIPILPIANLQTELLSFIEGMIPQSTYQTVKDTLEDIIIRPHTGLLSIGFILSVYYSTSGVHSLIDAFNNTYHEMETRSWFKVRLISLVTLLSLFLFIVIAIGMIPFGTRLIAYLFPESFLNSSFFITLLIIFKWIIIVASLFFAISLLYYLAPAKRRDFRFISAGSSLATLLLIMTTLGFNYYIDNFSKYNILYGSIGTVLILMLWIYFNSFSLIIGYELNASILQAKRKRR